MFGHWGDILRVIGRHLDSKGAEDVEITVDNVLAVRWKAGTEASESASYTEFDMDKLREQAPLMRRPIPTPPRGDREEMLRTLGQELDEHGIMLTDVVEIAGSYRVYGKDANGPVYRFYSRAEVLQLSEKRRAMRGVPAETAEATSASS